MGAHTNVETGLYNLIVAAAPSGTTTLIAVEPFEVDLTQFPQVVVMILNDITFNPSRELGVVRQWETYEWFLYVAAAGGNSPGEARTAAWTVMESIRTSVIGKSPETYSGQIELVREEFMGFHNAGVVYRQTINHSRWAG